MTIPPETERGYGKPVETLAAALVSHLDGFPDRRVTGEDVGWPDEYSPTEQMAARIAASDVLRVLRSKGWLSDLGITAIEDEGKRK